MDEGRRDGTETPTEQGYTDTDSPSSILANRVRPHTLLKHTSYFTNISSPATGTLIFVWGWRVNVVRQGLTV